MASTSIVRFKALALVCVWCFCLAVGVYVMLRYEFTPAKSAAAARVWPDSTTLLRAKDWVTLLMFIHPHCPCSRASLNELRRLSEQCHDRVAIEIVFIKPKGCDESWERSSLWDQASEIAGAKVYCDVDAIEAERFGATTSGEVLLYDVNASLIFQGGMTISRGHEGDNAGRAALTALIDNDRTGQTRSPVFGCRLTNDCCKGHD